MQIERIAGCPDVTLLIPVSLEFTVVAGHQHIHANVKLSVVIEHRIRNV